MSSTICLRCSTLKIVRRTIFEERRWDGFGFPLQLIQGAYPAWEPVSDFRLSAPEPRSCGRNNEVKLSPTSLAAIHFATIPIGAIVATVVLDSGISKTHRSSKPR